METVFKVGMKVYDQVNFPDMEGIVEEINIDSKYSIEVSFDDEKYTGLYYLDGTESRGFKPTLSTKPYKIEFQGFEQKAPVPTYEEALKEAQRKGDYYYQPYHLEVPSKELAKATMALLKLLFLRDYYNEDWQPKNSSYVYIITTRNRKLVKDCLMGDFRVLYFKSQEISNRFFEEQKELLEIAKPLL